MVLNSPSPKNNRMPSKVPRSLVPSGQRIELILNPSKNEHLPVGDTSNPVTYSRSSPNAQPIQTVRSVRDQGLLSTTGFTADDNVARVTKKARGMFFT